MGLTKSSTGQSAIEQDVFEKATGLDYTISFAGNPNVGKTSIFNNLTGMHQHTGNWPGKTVSNAYGVCRYNDKSFLLVDLPGTYSLMSNSSEEEIARNYICFGNSDSTVVVVDATTLERNLNLVFQILEMTPNVVVCVNLLDEAKKKGIKIDLKLLSKLLGVPVVGTIANKPKTLKKLLETINIALENKPSYNITCPVIYESKVEDFIKYIENDIKELLPNGKKYLSRFVALKLLDENSSINEALKIHLNIDMENNVLKEKIRKYKLENIEEDFNISSLRDSIVSSIVSKAEQIRKNVCTFSDSKYSIRTRKLDKILTSKKFGFPIMFIFLALIFWITISGANYPSKMLSDFFAFTKEKLLLLFQNIHVPEFFTNVLIYGMYQTLAWVVSVMLPPMAIFFPLFTLLEDLGYLPRIAFNVDNYFKKACSTGKQALTMCMGFGCNAAGVIGCRIIDSPREKIIAIITNAFVPCNGRFPFLITVATIFIGCYFTGILSSIVSTLAVVLIILLGIFLTLLISRILSKTILKGTPSSFILELPPYRKPQIGKILVRSLLDRTLFVLGRAISVAAPIGIVIWLFANISFGGISILSYIANFLDPFAKLMGLDGYILTAFILGIPANEIVLPIILMSYMSAGSLIDLSDTFAIKEILINNGWTLLTGINVMIFTLLHFPCSTTLITVYKETKSMKWTFASFALPTLCGIIVCMITTGIWHLVF